MKDKQDILDKVAKLMAMAEHPNTPMSEVENALEKANRILAKHNLSSDDLLLGHTGVDESVLEVEFDKYYKSWKWDLMTEIAKGNMCDSFGQTRTILIKGGRKPKFKKTKILTVIGDDVNRKITIQMFKTCVNKILQLAEVRYKEYTTDIITRCKKEFPELPITIKFLRDRSIIAYKGRYINSYIRGSINGISNKLKESQKNLLNAGTIESEKYGLIVVKTDELVKNFLEERHTDIKSSKRRSLDLIAHGYENGYADAQTGETKLIEQ